MWTTGLTWVAGVPSPYKHPACGSRRTGERAALWDLAESIQSLVMGDQGNLKAFLQTERATIEIDRPDLQVEGLIA